MKLMAGKLMAGHLIIWQTVWCAAVEHSEKKATAIPEIQRKRACKEGCQSLISVSLKLHCHGLGESYLHHKLLHPVVLAVSDSAKAWLLWALVHMPAQEKLAAKAVKKTGFEVGAQDWTELGHHSHVEYMSEVLLDVVCAIPTCLTVKMRTRLAKACGARVPSNSELDCSHVQNHQLVGASHRENLQGQARAHTKCSSASKCSNDA
jgi:uncharacterized membrane protein